MRRVDRKIFAPFVNSCYSLTSMQAMQIKSPSIVTLSHVIHFLDACCCLRMRFQRLFSQVTCLSSKLACFRVVPTCNRLRGSVHMGKFCFVLPAVWGPRTSNYFFISNDFVQVLSFPEQAVTSSSLMTLSKC